MELVDCHIHTTFSDGSSSLEEHAQRATELGVTTLACTDHLTLPRAMDPLCEVSVAEADLPAHRAMIERVRGLFPELDLVYGFECDYYPDCAPNIARWGSNATFLLGSVHGVDGRWIDDLSDLSYWEECGTDALWERYFEVWCEACTFGFDSMAHPDLIMLLGRFPLDPAAPKRFYHQAAEAARDCGVRIEVNTAGCIKPVGCMYPAPDFLEAFYRAGVPVTVGSDAHDARRTADRIEEAYGFLHRVGYRFIEVPTAAGGWRRVAL